MPSFKQPTQGFRSGAGHYASPPPVDQPPLSSVLYRRFSQMQVATTFWGGGMSWQGEIVRFVVRALLCAFAIYAIIVIGVLIDRNDEKARAQVDAFVDVFSDGDIGQILNALTSGPMIWAYWIACIAAGLLLQRMRKRSRS